MSFHYSLSRADFGMLNVIQNVSERGDFYFGPI